MYLLFCRIINKLWRKKLPAFFCHPACKMSLVGWEGAETLHVFTSQRGDVTQSVERYQVYGGQRRGRRVVSAHFLLSLPWMISSWLCWGGRVQVKQVSTTDTDTAVTVMTDLTYGTEWLFLVCGCRVVVSMKVYVSVYLMKLIYSQL